MMCYAMLCYAMLCYAMLCYAMLCYAMLCYAVLSCDCPGPVPVTTCTILTSSLLCYVAPYNLLPHHIYVYVHALCSFSLLTQNATNQHRQACIGTLLSLIRSLYSNNIKATVDQCFKAVRLYCSNLIKVR